MSNKENLWRLQDAEGQPAAEKPKTKWKDFGNVVMRMKMPDGTYKDLGELQTINMTRDVQPIYEMGSINPVHHVIANPVITITDIDEASADMAREHSRQITERIRGEIAHMSTSNVFTGAPTMRHETIEQTIPAIYDVIMAEVDRYRARYYDRPQFISLNKEGYRSFWLQTRRHMPPDVNDGDFMGMQVMCNPLQELPVMVLGSPVLEGMEGRLYHE